MSYVAGADRRLDEAAVQTAQLPGGAAVLAQAHETENAAANAAADGGE